MLVFWYRLLECLRGDAGWSFPGGFVDMMYFVYFFLCFSSPVVGLNTDGTRKNTQAVE